MLNVIDSHLITKEEPLICDRSNNTLRYQSALTYSISKFNQKGPMVNISYKLQTAQSIL